MSDPLFTDEYWDVAFDLLYRFNVLEVLLCYLNIIFGIKALKKD